MTNRQRIFQKDLISIRQFTYATRFRYKISIDEAADLVYELLVNNPEVAVYTVGNFLPSLLEQSEHERIVLGAWEEHWWEKAGHSDQADCYGIDIEHAVRLLDFASEEFDEWAPDYGENLAIWVQRDEEPQNTLDGVPIQQFILPLKGSASQGKLLPEKPLSVRERNTLLRIINSLAATCKLDLSQPYKAAEVVRTTAETLGDTISLDTIADKLRQARDLKS